MAMFGSAAFGCVVGWAACFAAGRRPSVWLARTLWLAVLACFLLAGSSEHPLPLIAGALFGWLSHIAFILLIRGEPSRRVSL